MGPDPQIRRFLERYNSIPGSHEEKKRLIFADRPARKTTVPLHGVEDRKVEGTHGDIPVRIYRPGDEPLQHAMVYFHGGGFYMGSIETHDELCRNIAHYSRVTVISAEYHLAPEYKFPVPVTDAYEVTAWAFDRAGELGLDPQRIGVAGDSAGGNLAASVTHLAKENRRFSPAFQLLIYPCLYIPGTASMAENGRGFMSDRDNIEAGIRMYVRGPEDRRNPLFSPVLFPDFRDLPPALIITAKYDSLRDDGIIYAGKLAEAGVPVTYVCYEDMIHGYLTLDMELEQQRNTYDRISEWLKTILHPENRR